MAHDIIVKQHGGKIGVETRLGEFTEVIITSSRDNRTSARKESIVVPQQTSEVCRAIQVGCRPEPTLNATGNLRPSGDL
jgi:hypothetical protein